MAFSHDFNRQKLQEKQNNYEKKNIHLPAMFVLYCELSSILTFALIYFQINTYTNTATTERLTFHTPPLSE